MPKLAAHRVDIVHKGRARLLQCYADVRQGTDKEKTRRVALVMRLMLDGVEKRGDMQQDSALVKLQELLDGAF